MEIWHRITFGKNDNIQTELEAWGIKYGKTPGLHGYYLLHVDISEMDSRWPQMAILVQKEKALDVFNTIFAREEILGADMVRLIPTFEQGYPEPKETWVTTPSNYEDFCLQCGTHRQTSNFRLDKDPTLGKKSFVSFYWTYTVFCTPQILKELQAYHIRGFEVWDAVLHRANTPSTKIRQLHISDIAGAGLAHVDDLRRTQCPVCGVTKYAPHMKGIMYVKHEALKTDTDIVRSYEWFGDGHSAYREIFISNRLARIIVENGWQGVQLKPITLV